ncbi:NAD-glutamate dehydrogenase domain-containing protein [Novosphingobium pentaromativorans]|uniref:Glutamate dehydrogenase n=1 Tax=Novosphingobium pentaromativorans US6-1 TaxID=1088721 RepID=G6EA44_9SPHN|nr:NAD-glutamate dehydrogenase domain-containing protein [Novosphingobium pentaromativorans]AIT80813.1 glutamate dehydrogenase [Novosphingobium pentaromativorans US6-1]EHJ61901.1 glutamate dehydrogenase [Novosphingobium pentaromativorans US6-1]
MSAGEVADPGKSRSRQSSRGASGQLEELVADRIRDSLLPVDGPADAAWIEDAARSLLAAAGNRHAGEPVIDLTSASDERRYLRIALINDDMPFLVDSVAAAIADAGLVIDRLAHPVLSVKRNAKGKLEGLPGLDAPGTMRESMIYIETARVDARQRRALIRSLESTLADVRSAVKDWPRMVEAMTIDAEQVDDTEGAALLRWFAGGMLTQLGHVTRRRDGTHGQLLGVCRRGTRDILSATSYDQAFAEFDRQVEAGTIVSPMVIKANRMATVHRRVPMDLFIVPVIDEGRVTALSVHAGIWTSAALAAPPGDVPRLRVLLTGLAGKLGLDPIGHTGKALAHALTSLPHDLVLGLGSYDVERLATTMTGLVDRPRPRLLITSAPLSRHLFVFVWLPRDMVSTQMRRRIQSMIEEAAEAPTIDWSLQVEAGNLAMMRFTLDIREGASALNEDALDQHLQVMLRGWGEAVEAVLAQGMDPARAAAVAGRYADAFPLSYRTDYGPVEAALDISHMRKVVVGEAAEGEHRHGLRDARLYRHASDDAAHLRLKVYQAEGSLPLSDAVPALENFGFRVLAEVPTPLESGRIGTIHDFTLALPVGRSAEEVLGLGEMIEDALCSVLNNESENDAFNRLVPMLGLSKRETNWLRAWYRYLRQGGTHFGIATVVDALQGAPRVTTAIIALFRAIHDPQFQGDREQARLDAEEQIRAGLADVVAINDDRLLRAYRDLVLAMQRTNAFAHAGQLALAFKFDSALVPGLPRPLPWREIFVYSRRVEGIHLRAGPVARGGLRWSDRRDDYRTEILGLMKAQRVKNAVIVPTGAKGGFYPKQLPDPALDRAGWAAEGQGCYEVFIATLLSVTDNIVKDKVVHPEDVVILDGEDPYFVVAADKGTAKFSDVANGIAESRDFWLDDAFASGGSNGYDHKAMGITARGAWLSVRRHFLEMGIDVQSQPVRVIGCGDMSGDVFGNGMLLSRAIKLVAAFDHRHIFFDPDPDPASSWAERKRMFDLPHSSWDDYDKSLISKGGGVFPRKLKSIPLSPEIRAALGIEAEALDPDSLITAILSSQADLLWFGGIGTYVKSAGENNVAVGDPANDTLRVNAADLHVKVIGEGANLGVTQAGRIEFAARGGRINADFIDNSAGVDCSDNEVNIKIALAAARRSGKLSEKKRNELLREMTDEVAELVLEDNRLQALALSIAQRGGASSMPSHIRLIEMLEESGNLDRRNEGLAENDLLQRRALDGQGLTRPELAVLLSSGKLVLQDAIEQSDLAADPSLTDLLLGAFPDPMQDKFARFIKGHRLAPEIIATKLANRIVNRLGIVHPFELAEEEGVGLAQIAAAFALAVQLFDLETLWERLEAAPMSEDARLLMFDRVAVATRGHMADLLRAGAGQVPPHEFFERIGKHVAALGVGTQSLLGERTLAHSQRLRAALLERGAPEAEATDVAHLFDLDGAVGIAELADSTRIDPRKLVNAFTRIGTGLGLDWAQSSAAIMNPSDPWERLLVAGLARDFQQMRLEFLRSLARSKLGKSDPIAAVEEWGRHHRTSISTFRATVARAENTAPITPAMLAQIASQARNLLGR